MQREEQGWVERQLSTTVGRGVRVATFDLRSGFDRLTRILAHLCHRCDKRLVASSDEGSFSADIDDLLPVLLRAVSPGQSVGQGLLLLADLAELLQHLAQHQ